MVKVVSRQLLSDGRMRLVFRHSEAEAPRLERYVPRAVLMSFMETVEVQSFLDGEGLRTDVLYPVFGMVQVRLHGCWREFVFVHRIYGTGVRDCARIGLEAWGVAVGGGGLVVGGGGRDLNVFVQRLPRGVESGVEVHGVGLFEAEWVCANAVAVG